MIIKNNISIVNWGISLAFFQLLLSGCGADCNTQNVCQLKGTQLLDEKDYSSAVKYFEKGCELGMGRSCYSAGLLYNSDKLGKEDTNTALEFYEKSCSLDNALGCTSAGAVYEKMKSGQTFAQEYYKKGCELKDFRACYLLGMANLQGKTPGKDDISVGLKYLDQACQIELVDSDEAFANNLLTSFSQGDVCWQAGAINQLMGQEQQAVNFYIKSCDQKNEDSCKELGSMLVNGGMNVNENLLTHFTNKCRVAKDPHACRILGDWADSLNMKDTYSTSRIIYGLACEYGDTEMCYRLGKEYSSKNDDIKAFTYYMFGCNAEHSDSCIAAGELAAFFGDKNGAADFYQKGCTLGNQTSCSRFKLFSEDKEKSDKSTTDR